MVITEEKLQEAVEVLRSFGVRRVLLFGGFAYAPEKAQDIDLAVEGIPLAEIWRADGAVGDVLDVPYDVVYREESPGFFDLVRKHNKTLFDGEKILPLIPETIQEFRRVWRGWLEE